MKKSEKKVYFLGCSFTDASHSYQPSFGYIKENYNIENLARGSQSNFQILSDVEILEENSIAFVQWSALTRPNMIGDVLPNIWDVDLNREAEKHEDPLVFYINNFIDVVTNANKILEEKNIKSFQYIGWVQWRDSEISVEMEEKLKKLPIHWFSSSAQIDTMGDTCWNVRPKDGFLKPHITSFLQYKYRKTVEWEWEPIRWGGMSEWIRGNIEDMDKRWVNTVKTHGNSNPHPSAYAGDVFYEKVIIPKLEELINE